MTLDNETEINPEIQFEYKGPLGFTLFWFLWSILGYLYMVLISESPSSSLEWFYLFLTVLSVMALNNRKYGINHTIRFYDDHIIVPRLLNSWFWQEEKISYKEIDEIDYLDYGDGTSKNLCEITLKTKMFTYPIFGKKLKEDEFQNIMFLLRNKTKMRVPELPTFTEDSGDLKEKRSAEKEITGSLALLSLFVSGLTILGISLSSPYSDIINGQKIFISSFLFSLVIVSLLTFFIKRRLKSCGIEKLGWKRIFLILYVWFYGGISTTFGLIFVNGKFGDENSLSVPVVLEKTLMRESRKGKCVALKNGNSSNLNRVPASTSSGQGSINICHKVFESSSVGDKFILKYKKGLFNEGWISDMVRVNN